MKNTMMETLPELANQENLTTMISLFLARLSEKKLPFFECERCNHRFPYPRLRCVRCGGTKVAMKYAKGKGRIYTYTIMHRAMSSSTRTPYVVAIVDLEEGIKVNANVALNDKLSIGQLVELTFDESAGKPKPIFVVAK